MQNLLNETIDEAKKVKESALKSAEFIVRGKMASELKDNYLKLLFENDSNEEECEIEEVDEDDGENNEKEEKSVSKSNTKKIAPTEDDDKLIINETDDLVEIFESFESLFKKKDLILEQDEAEEPQEEVQEEAPVEENQEEAPDDEEMEFDLSELQGNQEQGAPNAQEKPSEANTEPFSGVVDDPAEPKQDVKQIAVERFPFAYDRDTFKTDGKENKNKKSRIKLQPTYEEDSPLNPNNKFNFDELTESEEVMDDKQNIPDFSNATQKTPKKQSQMVKESRNSDENVTIPAVLMLEYMDKDVKQLATIKRLENEVKSLKEQVVKREKTIETYAKQLNESNRYLNESIKIQYKYKTLSDDSLSERQKRVICEQLDAHDNVETIGKIYETLRKSVGVGKNPNESLADLGSRATKSTIFLREQKERQQIQNNDFSLRLKKLAGIED